MKKKLDLWVYSNPALKKLLMELKIALFIIVAGVSNVLAVPSYSQVAKVSLDMKNATIEQVMDEIESQSEFYFIFNQKQIDINRVVDIQADNKLITDILPELFKGTNVNYMVFDRKILLTTDPVKNNLPASGTEPQQNRITGMVTDKNGAPIPGATVLISGSIQGVPTDNNGKYSIEVLAGSKSLIFSFIGMETQEITIGTLTQIDVTLIESTVGLNEVVVIGYGTSTRKNLTTAISQINPTNVPRSANSNVNTLLMGRAAGLQAFQGTAQPGGMINVSIRGGATPLYVVDGVVMSANALEPSNGTTAVLNTVNRSGLVGLNPDDIESIEVLKDASAAIYGIDAANGVILITTKKGKTGAVSITYDVSHSWLQNYPYYKPLDASMYMQQFNNFAKDVYMYDKSMGVYGSNTIDFSGIGGDSNIKHALYTDAQIANPGPTYNYLKSVLQPGSIDNHTLTFNGGSQAVHYYFSANYFNQKGTVVNSGLEKFSAHMNMDAQFLKIFKFGANVNVNKNNYQNSTAGTQTNGAGQQSYGAVQAAVAWLPTLNAINPDGTFAVDNVLPNPMGLLGINDQTASNGILGNFTLEAEILPKMLTAKVLFGDNAEYSGRSYHVPGNVFWDQMYLTRAAINDATRNNTTLEGTVNFNKEFSSIVNVNAVVGTGQYTYDEFGKGFTFSSFSDALGNYNAAAGTNTPSVNSYRSYSKKRSYFGRASFDIFDKYIITGTFRYDGDNRFFPKSKYAVFPSVSAAWKVTNESFLKNNPILNLLKIRGSFGVTGSNNLGASAYAIIQPSSNILSFNHGSTTYVTYLQNSVDNPKLTWQKQVMLNGGIDFSLLKDRVSGSFDVFQNEITNLLKYANTDQLSLLTTQPVNGGDVINNGYEFNLNTINIKTKDFTWNMSVTASHYFKHWKSRFAKDDLDPSYTGAHDAVDIIYYRPTEGIITDFTKLSAEQQATQTTLNATKPGYEIYTDTNGDGVIDNKDIKSVAAYPKIYLGWGNTFKYKNFDLDIYFYGQFGFKKYNHSYDWTSEAGMITATDNVTVDANNVWTPYNTAGILPGYTSVTHPVTISAGTYNSGIYPNNLTNSVGTDIGLEDASFLRCRNITFGYNFDIPAWKNYVKSLRVYFDLQNAFIITKYHGIDPEVYESLPNGSGVKGGPGEYPMARTFSIGLRVSL